jgi:predicted small lipoprotein YifL
MILAVVILAGCGCLKDPLEPPDSEKDEVKRRPASPFYDATRPANDEAPPSLSDRSDDELEAFRDRHR